MEVSVKRSGQSSPQFEIGPNGTGQKEQSDHIYSEYTEPQVTLEKLVQSLEEENLEGKM